MEKQRLRNLTTGRLHTDIGFIYQDLEFITGMAGLMTHQLPRVMKAVEPWLREQVADAEYWDEEFRPELVGEHPLKPMNEEEQQEMLARYHAQPDPLADKQTIVVEA